tara:strand:- start:19342 stop:21669 length:2328 start_codon:yes stop_codon:yes gene_type:complete
MSRSKRIALLAAAVAATVLSAPLIAGDPARSSSKARPTQPVAKVTPLVMPQMGILGGATSGLSIQNVHADVRIQDGKATTTLTTSLNSSVKSPRQVDLMLALPFDAHTVSFGAPHSAIESTILEADEAEAILLKDAFATHGPGLLEFVGGSVLRASGLTVQPGTSSIQIVFEHRLPRRGVQVDYVLPRSELLSRRVPWSVRVEIQDRFALTGFDCPSHEVWPVIHEPKRIVAKLTKGATTDQPGPLRFSYLVADGPLPAAVTAYADPDGPGGHFVLLSQPAIAPPGEARQVRREVTLVLDRSGSMTGEKFEQARAAAKQVLAGLRDGETFRIFDYSEEVKQYGSQPHLVSRESLRDAYVYLEGLTSGGGTNLNQALIECLATPPASECLPLVLFLTDGLATVGETAEATIRKNARTVNVHGRRIFPFGVGFDVNAPLLDAIGDVSRGTTTYVVPGEDVERAVTQVFQRLRGPRLLDVQLAVYDAEGKPADHLVQDILPRPIPDVYEGEPLILMGRYRQDVELNFVLTGTLDGEPVSRQVDLVPTKANPRAAYIPNLWAARRVAVLMDEVRQRGADPANVAAATVDPRTAELAEEILRLSLRYGIISEYTAFLGEQQTDLCDWAYNSRRTKDLLAGRTLNDRSGSAGVNQGRNWNEMKGKSKQSYSNPVWTADNARREFLDVQPMADRALFRRAIGWIDGRLLGPGAKRNLETPDQEIMPVDQAYRDLLHELGQAGQAGLMSFPTRILLERDGKTILIRNDTLKSTRTEVLGSSDW